MLCVCVCVMAFSGPTEHPGSRDWIFKGVTESLGFIPSPTSSHRQVELFLHLSLFYSTESDFRGGGNAHGHIYYTVVNLNWICIHIYLIFTHTDDRIYYLLSLYILEPGILLLYISGRSTSDMYFKLQCLILNTFSLIYFFCIILIGYKCLKLQGRF